jgi:hypothetical protein
MSDIQSSTALSAALAEAHGHEIVVILGFASKVLISNGDACLRFADSSSYKIKGLGDDVLAFVRSPYCPPELKAKVRTPTKHRACGVERDEMHRVQRLHDRGFKPMPLELIETLVK